MRQPVLNGIIKISSGAWSKWGVSLRHWFARVKGEEAWSINVVVERNVYVYSGLTERSLLMCGMEWVLDCVKRRWLLLLLIIWKKLGECFLSFL